MGAQIGYVNNVRTKLPHAARNNMLRHQFVHVPHDRQHRLRTEEAGTVWKGITAPSSAVWLHDYRVRGTAAVVPCVLTISNFAVG